MTKKGLVSIIIPSRNEIFLNKTIEDLLKNATGEIEIIAILDGYWPKEHKTEHWTTPAVIEDERVIYFHRGQAQGMRPGINAAVKIAKGEYILKIDAHCMVGPGYDTILKADCEDNWVVTPTRHRLNPEEWINSDGGRPQIDYLYMIQDEKGELNVKEDRDMNRDPELKKKLIDDMITCQGSFWFMKKTYFYELELMDVENYGTFRKESQEITFKAWLSGGRCIRNKKTWYAHLHKGRHYGRGYSTSKPDWQKGDQFLNEWLTNSAWDKQTIDFRWLVDKFDRRGLWKDYKWENRKLLKGVGSGNVPIDAPPEEKINPALKLYQNLGEGFHCQNPKKKHSRFWNKGKWYNFVEPWLLTGVSNSKPLVAPFVSSKIEDLWFKDMSFVEVGCNAGLFPSMAKRCGFRNVVGIEKDKTPVAEGKRYRDSLGLDYRLLNRSVGGQFGENGSFDFNELPVADYTLLSTCHYYFDINAWHKYLDQLKNKTRYVIVVSRTTKRRHWRALSELKYVREYFKDWEEVGIINDEDVSKEGDPAPRELFSICFKSKLERWPIDQIKEATNGEMYDAVAELAREIDKNPKLDIYKTKYCRQWLERKHGIWSDRAIRHFVKEKYKTLLSIKEIGMIDPAIIQPNGKLCDGGHRIAMMKALGYKSAIVRKTCQI